MTLLSRPVFPISSIKFGKKPLNLLVNNAGIAIVKPFCEITSVEWEQTVGVNITAPFMLMQHFTPHMPPGSSMVEYSFHRREHRICELERILHEQVRARRFVTMRARRIAGAQNPSDQRLPSRDRHEHLESDRGKVAAPQNDFARGGCQRRGVRALSAQRTSPWRVSAFPAWLESCYPTSLGTNTRL